jgi:hypothetical protein
MVHFENAVDDKNLKLVKMINQIYHFDEIFSYVLEIINACSCSNNIICSIRGVIVGLNDTL